MMEEISFETTEGFLSFEKGEGTKDNIWVKNNDDMICGIDPEEFYKVIERIVEIWSVRD